jgi:hypothetical protein
MDGTGFSSCSVVEFGVEPPGFYNQKVGWLGNCSVALFHITNSTACSVTVCVAFLWFVSVV